MSTKSAEETIRGLIQAAKENAPEHQTVDGIESWKITMDGEVYKVSVVDRKAKTGRAFNCHGLVKILPDGTEETVNLGAWKKKLFYTLTYNLQQGKVFKKNEQNPTKVKAIVKDMKENPVTPRAKTLSRARSTASRLPFPARRRPTSPARACIASR